MYAGECAAKYCVLTITKNTSLCGFEPINYSDILKKLLVELIAVFTRLSRLAALRCAVVVCCHLADRLALTVRKNESNIAHYITDFHQLYNYL